MFLGMNVKAVTWLARRGIFWGAVMMVAGVRGVAFGGPPFRTDDPEPVDLHHGELYAATSYELRVNGFSATVPMVEFNYGIFPNTQFHVVTPLALEHENNGPTDYGYGDTEVGVKYRFVEEKEWVPMIGVLPLVELPTGSRPHGLGNGRVQLFLPVWMQKSFGDWTTYGGGGYWFNNADGTKGHWFAGWEVQRKINEHLALGGELFYQTADAEGAKPHLGFNIGPMIDINDHHHILLSAGRDLIGDVQFTTYVAYQFTW